MNFENVRSKCQQLSLSLDMIDDRNYRKRKFTNPILVKHITFILKRSLNVMEVAPQYIINVSHIVLHPCRHSHTCGLI